MSNTEIARHVAQLIITADEPATLLQKLGSGGFGFLVGWYVYYINRYRKGDVQLTDLVTLIGIIGGTAVLALFPARSDFFGAYGIGLFAGFFGYFITLIFLVGTSKNFTADWFLDGRRKKLAPDEYIPTTAEVGGQERPPMGLEEQGGQRRGGSVQGG